MESDGRNLMCLRTNTGLEFCGEKFSNFYRNQGIVKHRTVKTTPQQNGLVERVNCTILERVRCMFINIKLLAKFWVKVVHTACHLINKCPLSAINFRTPQEVWTGKPGSYQHLRVFGSTTYVLVNDGKLQPRAKKKMFFSWISYWSEGVKFWCPDLRKAIISRDVTFKEDELWGLEEKNKWWSCELWCETVGGVSSGGIIRNKN